VISFDRVSGRNLYLLDTFERTPDPEPWVKEVEEIAYGPGAATAIVDDEVTAWFVYDDDALIGVAIQQRAHPKRYVELLHTLCIRHSERRKHGGQRVLEALLAHVRDHSEFGYVSWLVHPDNDPMNKISRRIAPDQPAVDSRGNYLYTWP
jgi:hypothetical protein